jgi:DNA-binding MarR family transcriptional regulator
LEKHAYIVKARDPADQRAVKLALSEKGAELLKLAPKPARGLLPESLRQLDARQLAQLNSGLQGLLDSIGTIDDGYGLEPLPFTM